MSKSEFEHPFSGETFEKYCDNTGQIPNEVALNTWDYLMPQIHNWVDTANLFHSNSDYYRGICVKIGELLSEEVYICGEEVYMCDDGTKSEDVLVAKLVEVLKNILELTNDSH